MLDGVFYGCISLEKVVLEEGIETIPWNAFAFCDSIKTIVIPESVNKIEPGAFYACNSMKKIIFKNPKEWYIQFSPNVEMTKVDLTNEKENAKYLTDSFATLKQNRNSN